MVNSKDKHNRTPLHLSASNGNDAIFWQLLSHGAVIDVKDDQGATPLHRAVDGGNNEVCRLLLDRYYFQNLILYQNSRLEYFKVFKIAISL